MDSQPETRKAWQSYPGKREKKQVRHIWTVQLVWLKQTFARWEEGSDSIQEAGKDVSGMI